MFSEIDKSLFAIKPHKQTTPTKEDNMETQAKKLLKSKSQIGKHGKKYLLIMWIDGDIKSAYADNRSDLKQLCKELSKLPYEDMEFGSAEYLDKDGEYSDCSMSQKNAMINFSNWFETFIWKIQNNKNK